MRASPNYPQCHEDRKIQKLLDRIDKETPRESRHAQFPPSGTVPE
jgi:hypothetical protein